MTDTTQSELDKRIDSHEKWLNGDPSGKRLDLSGVNLEVANLYGANLYGATLYSAYLKGANLCRANLYSAYLKGANLCRANLKDANLYHASLDGANLEGANLKDANLEGAIGDGVYIKNIDELYYSIAYTNDRIQIGCQNYSHEEWQKFSDLEILEMDGETALKFWRESKDYIFEHIAENPAKETGFEK
jgi:uncharacterized protein YjbI with pentapeptide repeats